VESVLQCVGVGVEVDLTHPSLNPVFFTNFQKYIQNHMKNADYQWLLQFSPVEVDYTMNDYYKGLLLEYLL
tara:strand:+ start:897 stop:1109 length:213 start_codon:yes stop_codon:yes gene_type:complete